MHKRRGFTIIEVAVAMAVVAVLVAITLPAVMFGRERSRQATCQDRLRQVGLALHNFESVNGKFPADFESHELSGLTLLLRFFDEAPLAERTLKFGAIGYEFGQQGAAYDKQLTFFRCPSDASVESYPGVNYRLCIGSDVNAREITGPNDLFAGAFGAKDGRLASQLSDGLSNTAGVSERLVGSWREGSFDPTRDMWYSGLLNITKRITRDELLGIAQKAPSEPANVCAYMGLTWYFAGFENTWYNHVLTPNSSVPDCSAGDRLRGTARFIDFKPATASIVSASSNHSGGAHTLFMDGSVRFTSDSVDLGVWRAMGTAAAAD